MTTLSICPKDRTNTPLQTCRLKELCGPGMRSCLLQSVSTLMDIQEKKIPKLSLRRLDWMVTNYCKTLSSYCCFPKRWPGDTYVAMMHEVYLDYRRNYKRVVFDPFCRTSPIEVTQTGRPPLSTTVAQLNFFCFLVQTGLLDFALQSVDTIARHQQTTLERRTEKKKCRHHLTAPKVDPYTVLHGSGLTLRM